MLCAEFQHLAGHGATLRKSQGYRDPGLALASARNHSSRMRRAISLILYLLIVAAGAWILARFFNGPGGRVLVPATGLFLVALGSYLIWHDFIGPKEKR
jgi:hypothetical protein